jgi:hypothetical protein
MAMGGGYWHAHSNDIRTTSAGGGIDIDVAVGYAVQENLVVFGNYFASIHPETKHSTYASDRTVTQAVMGFGPGLAYYLMPLNLYFSGALTFVTEGSDKETDHLAPPDLGNGVGGKLMVGKDWWVSANWSLGAAADFMLATMWGKKDPKPNWVITAVSALFVATFN